jgi:hypothetical protein
MVFIVSAPTVKMGRRLLATLLWVTILGHSRLISGPFRHGFRGGILSTKKPLAAFLTL